MSDHSGIEWTDATWNPVTGCTKVSPGCANCYIERQTPMRVAGLRFVRGHIPIELHANRLDAPLRRRKPTVYFVNSMSDLFHEDVPDAFIARVFDVMATAVRHTFQVLTKRPERMLATLLTLAERHTAQDGSGWPLRNVWLGVSVENQRFADERIPRLLETPAAVRWISAEPLLEAIDVTPYVTGDALAAPGPGGYRPGPALDWIVVGGESGPGARVFDLAWARSLRCQCLAAKVAFFVKQLGSHAQDADGSLHGRYAAGGITHEFPKLLDRKGGDPTEWPADLRVRDYPHVTGPA